MTEKPKVSVICITYGHEDHIAQALDSFLMQKTEFPFQILVGEDNGPDKTAEIVKNYAEKYPDKIVPFIRKESIGAQRNLVDLCRRAETEYLAFCEGDDYWMDEYKLQKQFDLMEAHPEYNMCFHNTMIMADPSWYLYECYDRDDNGSIVFPGSIPDYDTTLTEMKADNYIKYSPAHSSSMFYRWDNSKEIPEWYYTQIYWEHSLVMIQVGDGLIGYIPETMSVGGLSEERAPEHESKTDLYIKSQQNRIEMAVDIESYYLSHYGLFANSEIRDRIVHEFNDYIQYIINTENDDLLREAYIKYAYPASLAIEANLRNQSTINKLKSLYSENGFQMLITDSDVKEGVSKLIDKRKIKKKEKIKENISKRLNAYVKDNKAIEDKKLWVFSYDNQWYYSGNVRHLYEYILAYHPEISAVWITRSITLTKLFDSEGKPYAKIGSEECKHVLEKAAVAFVNNYKILSFGIEGINKNTKIVRLGDGIRPEGKERFNAYQRDLRTVPFITAEEIISKHPENYDKEMLTEETRSYFTEDYPNTFLQLAENDRMLRFYNEVMGIPEEAIIKCVSPRCFAVREKPKETNNVIALCPGFRARVSDQIEYADALLKNIDSINAFLEKEDCFLRIMIPNDYYHEVREKLQKGTDRFPRMEVSEPAEDLFSELINIDAMITDWSSAMFDFALQNKPVVLLNPDKIEQDVPGGMLYKLDEVAPGAKADDWEEALNMILERMNDPDIDSDKRRKTVETIYDTAVNGDKDLECIVTEIKQRLDIQ